MSYISKSIGINLTKEDFDKTSDKIHEFRAKAISEKIELADLIKVFAHIIKNRGYKGDLKRDDGEVSKKIKETKEMFGDNKTLGQVLHDKKLTAQNNEPWRKLNQDGTFILRKDIENEFELIWAEQIKHHK